MDAIRAWKDVDYRDSLSNEELASVPTHPGGQVCLDLGELSNFAGAGIPTLTSFCGYTVIVCTQPTVCGLSTCAGGTFRCCW